MSTALQSINNSLRKQEELCERIVTLLPRAPTGESSKSPADEFLDDFEQWVSEFMTLTPYEEACVLDTVLGWGQRNVPEQSNWLLHYLKGEVEHQSISTSNGRTSECVLFAIPVLFPLESVYDSRLVGEEGVEVIRNSLTESRLISEMAECQIANSMVSYRDISGRSFGELKRLSENLAQQFVDDRTSLLQIPGWFYEEAPAVNNWARSFNTDLQFIIGIASVPREMLPELFTLSQKDDPFNVPLRVETAQSGVMPSGMAWEELMARQLAYTTVTSQIPYRVAEPLPLYSAVESSLELARLTVMQMTVLELEEIHNISRDSVCAILQPYCRHQDGKPTHINVHLLAKKSLSQRLLTVRWPVLPHEDGTVGATDELLHALDLCSISLHEDGLGEQFSPSSMTVH